MVYLSEALIRGSSLDMIIPLLGQVKAWSAVDKLHKVVTHFSMSLQGPYRFFTVFQDDCFASGLTQRYKSFMFVCSVQL